MVDGRPAVESPLGRAGHWADDLTWHSVRQNGRSKRAGVVVAREVPGTVAMKDEEDPIDSVVVIVVGPGPELIRPNAWAPQGMGCICGQEALNRCWTVVWRGSAASEVVEARVDCLVPVVRGTLKGLG